MDYEEESTQRVHGRGAKWRALLIKFQPTTLSAAFVTGKEFNESGFLKVFSETAEYSF